MLYSTTTFAVLGLATLAQSHMIMTTPVPFGKSSLLNGPLQDDGSDFPCKQRPGVYDLEGANNMMPLGSTQSLGFKGSATHGGGSCQVSITYDKEPTKSSVWKVIHSIEGGCPIKNTPGNTGNDAGALDPDTYPFTIPTSLPTGTAVLAWTWFNKVGNREMYMNCAPITLTAASSKRSDEEELVDGNYTMLVERDISAYNALPDMFVANIGNGCKTSETDNLKFPDPGNSLEKNNGFVSGVLPIGSCSTTVAHAAGTAGPAPATKSAQASAPAAIGGVFITVSAVSSSPAMATASPVASSATIATVAPVSSVSEASSTPVESSPPVASTPAASSSTPASTGASGSGSAMAAGTACTPEGEWNCIGGTSYQRCASGAWSVVQQLAAGTSCTVGQMTNINIIAKGKNKRAVRFSNAHVRRHIQKS